MRALDITQFTAPIDRLFAFCHEAKGLGTTGIGDGGNEIGTYRLQAAEPVPPVHLPLMLAVALIAGPWRRSEAGMGKVTELVKKHIPRGEIIACATATDNLIVTGISNWGGYALAASLQLLRAAASPDGTVDAEMLVSRQQDSDILDAMLAAGAVDGPLCQNIRSVDGLAFDEYVATLETLREKVASAFSSH